MHFEKAVRQRRRFETGGAEVSGRPVYRVVGISPSEIDVAQLYDSFSSNPLMLAGGAA